MASFETIASKLAELNDRGASGINGMEFDMIGHSPSLRQCKAVAPSVASFSARAWSVRF
jgi:hypothetical protein